MGYLHDPWPLQDQDPPQASHQGRSEDGLWPGDEGEGEAGQDCRQGFPSCCTQGADLRGAEWAWMLRVSQRLDCCGNPPTEQVWVTQLHADYRCAHRQCMCTC